MTDSMKFGPEWLRNLSGDGCNTGGGGGGPGSLTAPRYQLAEYRYGREEMLALFDRNYKPPEPLATFPTLYVEKPQQPLALIQMTEEETRMWNGGITNSGGRGRGGSVDRGGRGRGGRGGVYAAHYTRGVSFDEPGDGPRVETQPFQVQGRSRPFDRSQSERGWSERNGAPEPGDWNGSTSPRKELGRGTSGGALMEGNWRRHRAGGEDDDGWRVASGSRGEKWGRSSWRDGGGSERDRMERADGGEAEEGRGGGRWEHRGNHRAPHDSSHHPPARTSRTWEANHHDNHDNLPEWATENPSESGGSFDASGAFHGGMYSDDDEDGIISAGGSRESRTRHMSEGTNSNNTKPSKPLSHTNSLNQGQTPNRRANNASTTIRERPKSLQPYEDKDSSEEQERNNVSPQKPAPTLNNTQMKTSPPITNSTPRKVQSATNLDKLSEKNPMQSVQKSPTRTPTKETRKLDSKKEPPAMTQHQHPQQPQLQSEPQKIRNSSVAPPTTNVRQKSEDDLDRMKEEADALVAKLMADEEMHKDESSKIPTSVNNQVPGIAPAQEKWFYRDPQGEVQGPFLANEMTEWFKAGYFTVGLLLRRACDERYSTLGDLIKMWGRVPFMPGPPIPPLKMAEPVIPVPTGMPGGVPKTAMEDPLLMYQYQQMRLIQNQQILIRQMRASAINKLSQSEHWSSLSSVEQNQLILQYVLQNVETPEIPIPTNPFVPPLATPPSNSVMQLFTQIQQAKAQAENHLPPSLHPTTPTHPGQMDPIQQLIQQLGGMQNIHGVQQPNITPTPTPTQEDNPIKSLLRQLNVNVNGHPQPQPQPQHQPQHQHQPQPQPQTQVQPPQMDSIWPQPPPQVSAPQFNAQNWLAQVGPIPAMPPGQIPNAHWDLHAAKEMKTEQQILEEQKHRLLEERKKDEFRKQEELKRLAEEANAKRKLEEEQARKAEEVKRKDEEKKRKEEEKHKLEEQRKKEEKKRKEEERKREEKRKQDEENNRKKQEEEKRKREEAKRQEEKLRKEEEKRKKLEEEQRRVEEERIKKEEEARRKAEAEEQARRVEQRRREAEALRKLQERSKAPWAQAPHAPPPSSQASLAEIQRLEREKKAEELRLQQLMQQQLVQQRAAEAAQEAAVAEASKGLQLKWAEKAVPVGRPQVKSLAQIQQEEQERLAKVKQQERERQEKAAQKEPAVVLQSTGIWGTAAQSLNWATTAGSNSQAWANSSGAGGFWDEPTPIKAVATPKQPAKQPTPVKSVATPVQQQNNKATKSKNKKEEVLVKKLFEQNTAKADDFTQWCSKALSGLQASVDIPTFVGFLRDIESAYEVKEYVRMYLGDSKQCTEFGKQFLEKRSKWRSAQRPHPQADDLCKPAPAVNPNATATEFQEVKGKAKKPKKGKMFKVDSSVLGFSVTAAPDRINVGDRDYGEGV